MSRNRVLVTSGSRDMDLEELGCSSATQAEATFYEIFGLRQRHGSTISSLFASDALASGWTGEESDCQTVRCSLMSSVILGAENLPSGSCRMSPTFAVSIKTLYRSAPEASLSSR